MWPSSFSPLPSNEEGIIGFIGISNFWNEMAVRSSASLRWTGSRMRLLDRSSSAPGSPTWSCGQRSIDRPKNRLPYCRSPLSPAIKLTICNLRQKSGFQIQDFRKDFSAGLLHIQRLNLRNRIVWWLTGVIVYGRIWTGELLNRIKFNSSLCLPPK